MNKQIIEVPYNVKFINEWTDFNTDLLRNHSIINKTITGCGFTSYALTNNIPTILCSPRKFLLANKHKQLKNTYLVINKNEKGTSIDSEGEETKAINPIKELFNKPKKINIIDNKEKEDFSELCTIQEDLRSYILNCNFTKQPPKILVTYDSLKHVLDVVGDMIKYYSVIVDEFQNIFIDASFKADTELNFINVLQNCPNVTYLSATPYIEDYLEELDEFKDLPYYEFKWHPDRLQTIKVDMRKTHHLGTDIDKIIQDYLQNRFPEKVDGNGVVHQSREVVFYTNSVKLIVSTIKRNSLTPDQVNIICADTEKNRKSLERLGLSIGIAPLENEPHKMFTFCTRTTYAGADFYSPCALSVIVSDCKIDSLSTDIRMDFPQIMGRQRLVENIFKDECIFIYKLSDTEVTLKQFDELSKEKLEKSRVDLTTFHTMKNSKDGRIATSSILEDYRDRISKYHYGKDYTGINEKTGEPMINKLVYIAERRAFELRSDVYKSEVQIYNEFSKIITDISKERQIERIHCLSNAKNVYNSKGSFEQKMKVVCDILLDPYWYGYIHITDFHWLPLSYRNYLNYLGPSVIRSLSHKESEIKQRVTIQNSGDIIRDKIIQEFPIGLRLLVRDCKERLRAIYKLLGVIQTPKATDLLNYFEVSEFMITDKTTGKRLKGYEILAIKP